VVLGLGVVVYLALVLLDDVECPLLAMALSYSWLTNWFNRTAAAGK
jgi:hypothetical protein